MADSAGAPRSEPLPPPNPLLTFYVNLVHDRTVLLWMHPIPATEVQKVFKPVRAAKPPKK